MKTILFSLCFLFSVSVFPQQVNIDSLKNIVANAPNDTNKVIAYRSLCGTLASSDPAQSLYYGFKGTELGKKIHWDKGVAGCYLNLGNTYGSLAKYDSALIVNDSALVYALKVGDANRIALVYINRAAAYIEMSRLEEAMKTALLAQPYAEKAKNPDRLARVYMTMGNISYYQESWKRAIDEYRKSLPLFIETNTKNMIGTCYMNIANCYKNLNELDSAIMINAKAIKIFEEIQDIERLLIAYHNDGSAFFELKKYDKAEAALLKALPLAKSYGNKDNELLNQNKLAEVYAAQNKYEEAIQILLPAIDTANKYAFYKQVSNLSLTLSDLYFNYGNFKSAYKYLQMYYAAEDTIDTREENEKLIELQTQYETAQKDKEIALQDAENLLLQQKTQRQRVVLFAALGLSVLSLLSIFLFLNRTRIKQQVKELQLRNEIALDLHDEVGSSLSSIKMLSEIAVMQNGNKDILEKISNNAKDSAEKMQDIIWMINPKNDNTENMLQRMQKFLQEMCEPMNIKHEFNNTISGIKLDMHKRKNILLIYKEAVNNAVKYSGANKITTEILLDQQGIILQITDNGKGFDKNLISPGNGLDSMRIRAEELKGAFSLYSEENKGTHIVVSVPL
ncbi:MAG: tetratricopeptide repeat protein [Chitinophagales bacterium]